MPDAQILAGAVADIFGALAVAPGDTRLEPGRKNLLWLAVNILHRAIGRTRRELDDRGAEEPPTGPGRPKNPLGRARTPDIRRDDADRTPRHHKILPRPGRRPVRASHELRLATARGIDGQPPHADLGHDRQPRFIAAKRRAETEVLVPAGPKIAVTCGLDFNDHRLIRDKLDRVHAKHPDMVLLHGGSPRGAERIAAKWADNRKVPQIAFKPGWTRHAKAAPFKRNDALLEVLPIGVMVFPGTNIQDNLADKAKKLGILVWKFGTGGA